MTKANIEAALEKINSRFDLITVTARRAHQLQKNKSSPLIENEEDKPTVVALLEVENGLINSEILDNFDRMLDLKRHQDAQRFSLESKVLYSQDSVQPLPSLTDIKDFESKFEEESENKVMLDLSMLTKKVFGEDN